MYCITDEQVAYILNDIRRSGVEMEDLQLNLLDHICCIVEHEFKENDDFERFYKQTVQRLCKEGLYEIEDETIKLLTFKNYYVMKKAMVISGTISAAALIFGSFFKAMYWPGASVLLGLGILSLGFVFLPLMAILRTREAAVAGDKLITIMGSLMGVLFCTAVIAAVMHLPGARSGMYWWAAIGFSLFVFIPIYFFNGIRDAEKKVNTIVTTILLIGFTCLQFTMIGIRRAVPQLPIYTYLANDHILKTIQQKGDGGAPGGDKKLAADINGACEELKGIILLQDIKSWSIPEDFEEKNIVINERIVNFDGTDKASGILKVLKEKVNAYNATAGNDGKIPLGNSILNISPKELDRTTNVFVLNSLTQLQICLAMGGTKKDGTTAVAIK